MSHCLPNSARAAGSSAEQAGHLGKMMEHQVQTQPNPGLPVIELSLTCYRLVIDVQPLIQRRQYLIMQQSASIFQGNHICG